MFNIPKEVIEEWGLQSLSEDKQADIVERIGRMIYQAVLVRSLDILSEKEQAELDLIMDKDQTTPENVLAFLKSKIPTFDTILAEEKQKIKDDVLVQQN